MSNSRFPDLREHRKTVAALYLRGFPNAARSILLGITRPIYVNDDDDWLKFQEQMGQHRREAWFGTDIESFIDDPDLMVYALSYRHVDWRTRSPKGATMNRSQWARLRGELVDSSRRNRVQRFVLWLDQILECSESLTSATNWVTKGVLPYVVLPVLYIGGPGEEPDEKCQARLWPSIERAAALTSGGIVLHGSDDKRDCMTGASIGVAPSLHWLAKRVIGGTFNRCELSWKSDYLAMREMSLHIVRSEQPLNIIEEFVRIEDKLDRNVQPKYELFSVSQAFRWSRDSERLISTGRRFPFLGTYLASRVEKALSSDGQKWHGMREWVQYEWDDGVLTDETEEELEHIRCNTHWGLFTNGKNKKSFFAVGVVSESIEVQAMGVAEIEGLKKDGGGSLLWFQRGLSPKGVSYGRQIAKKIMPDRDIFNDIGKHWNVLIGDPIALVKGNEISWTWKNVTQ